MANCDKSIINRLRRIEGQTRGIQKMIAEESDCQQVITQLNAVRSGIDRVMGIIVAENLQACLENPDEDLAIQQHKIEQAINMIIKK